jgi:hypothetical protein
MGRKKNHRGCLTQEARGAQGIAAEIPQDLHRQIRGIGAESPVFCEAKNVHMRFGKGSLVIKKMLNRLLRPTG